MKQQKFFVIVMTVCALLLSLAGCASSSAFDGSSAKNADSYHLDVKIMNGTDTHTLELKQGDTLKILFETVKGSLEMKITSPDGTSLYQGDGTVTEFTVEAPVDGPYAIVVAGQNAKGRIHVDVDKVPASTEPAATPEPSNSAVEEESLPAEVPTRESTDTSVSIVPPVQEHNNPDAVTADDLVGSWHLAGDEKDNATAMEAIPGAMESGRGGEDESETSYPGADVVEIVNLRGDTTTAYKLVDGTYMDRIERRFTYNGTDTWIDEDGAEWKLLVLKM